MVPRPIPAQHGLNCIASQSDVRFGRSKVESGAAEGDMEVWPRKYHLRDWVGVGAVFASIAFGPVFLKVGYALHLVFGAGGIFYLICSIIVVPLLTLAAGRWKFVAWQAAIISVTVTVIYDFYVPNPVDRGDVPRTAYVFWAGGTLFSAPLPVYFFLRPMAPRQRLVFALVLAAVGIAMWLGLKRITG